MTESEDDLYCWLWRFTDTDDVEPVGFYDETTENHDNEEMIIAWW